MSTKPVQTIRKISGNASILLLIASFLVLAGASGYVYLQQQESKPLDVFPVTGVSDGMCVSEPQSGCNEEGNYISCEEAVNVQECANGSTFSSSQAYLCTNEGACEEAGPSNPDSDGFSCLSDDVSDRCYQDHTWDCEFMDSDDGASVCRDRYKCTVTGDCQSSSNEEGSEEGEDSTFSCVSADVSDRCYQGKNWDCDFMDPDDNPSVCRNRYRCTVTGSCEEGGSDSPGDDLGCVPSSVAVGQDGTCTSDNYRWDCNLDNSCPSGAGYRCEKGSYDPSCTDSSPSCLTDAEASSIDGVCSSYGKSWECSGNSQCPAPSPNTCVEVDNPACTGTEDPGSGGSDEPEDPEEDPDYQVCNWCTNQSQCSASGCSWEGQSSYCSVDGDGCCSCGGSGGSGGGGGSGGISEDMLNGTVHAEDTGSERWAPTGVCSGTTGDIAVDCYSGPSGGKCDFHTFKCGGDGSSFEAAGKDEVVFELTKLADGYNDCRWRVFSYDDGGTVKQGEGCKTDEFETAGNWKRGVQFTMLKSSQEGGSGGNEGSYTAIADYDYKYLVQGLLNNDGTESYSRTCPINENGVLWDSCSGGSGNLDKKWGTVDLTGLANDLGVSGFSDYGAFVYEENGSQKLLQSFYTADYQSSWGRTCPINIDGSNPGVDWSGCGEWFEAPLDNEMQALGTSGFNSYGAFTVIEDGQPVVYQSIRSWHQNNLGWGRTCPIKQDGVDWAECSGWNEHDSTSIANQLGADNGFDSYGAYTYSSGGKTYVSQSLFEKDLTISHYRRCEVDSSGIKWGDCANTWSDVDNSQDVKDVGVTQFGGYGAFVFGTNTPINMYEPPEQPTARVQGRRVAGPEGTTTTITVNNNSNNISTNNRGNNNNNAYGADDLSPGQTVDVSTTVPNGYVAYYSTCNNCIEHPAGSYRKYEGSTQLQLPSQTATNRYFAYLDLYWKYLPDFNGDGNVTILDVIRVIVMTSKNQGGDKVDVNNDGNKNVMDAIYLLKNLP